MLKFLSFAFGLLCFLAAIWIVVPAPDYRLWLFAVAASEWSLWLAMISLIAIVSGVYSIFYVGGKLSFATLIFSLAALCISLYPLFSALKLADEKNVSLSFAEYFSGLSGSKISDDRFATHAFARIQENDLLMDVYAPQTKNENNGAAIIVVHGGSWNSGKRNDFPQWNRWLADNGFTVFDIDYRLAPQPNYAAATGDVKCAVVSIKNRAAEFSVSPDRIAVFGRSAGGQLALLAAYSAGDSRLPPSCAANGVDESVRAVVSFYAPIDLFWGFNNPANERVINGRRTLAAFLGGDPNRSAEMRERFALVSPTERVSAKTPPTFLVHGGEDQLVRPANMRFLDAKLTENDVVHKAIFIPYAQHGFDYNFHGFGSQITKAAMLEFLQTNTR